MSKEIDLEQFEGREFVDLIKDKEFLKAMKDPLSIDRISRLLARAINGTYVNGKYEPRGFEDVTQDFMNGTFGNIQSINTIEKLDSIPPIKYIMANNKFMNKLSSGELVEGLTELLVIDKKKKQVVTPISLNYDDENIQIANKDKRFTPYDRAVHNSVCSIFEAGNSTFTPDQVYRCMNGLNNTEKVSPQAIESVTESIDKIRRMYTKILIDKEAKEYGLDKIIMEDHILSAKKITLEAGGHEVVGYKFNYSNNSKPIIYEYAQITGQVLTIPRELLNTKDVIRSTTEVTIIREYLIRRIEVMKRKGNKHQSNKIRFISIYKEIGQDDPTKQKAQRVRENIEKLLGSFKDNDYIKGYKFYKEGRSFKGIEILY